MRIIDAKEMEDTTLLIQGQLREDTYKFYCNFYPEVPKVFSTWTNNCEFSRWKGLPNIHSSSDEFFENEVPTAAFPWDRRLNLELVSMSSGLDMVKTKYVIKLRGDEWYSNLCLAKNYVVNDPERIFMASIFVKKWHIWPARMSDHILVGSKERIKMLYNSCLSGVSELSEVFKDCWPIPYQSMLAMSYIRKNNKNVTDMKSEFQKLFGLIFLDDLRYYKVCSDDGRTHWYSNFNPIVRSLDEV